MVVCAMRSPVPGARAAGEVKPPPPPARLSRFYTSKSVCCNCHNGQQHDDQGIPFLCKLNECKTWEQDKHADATEQLRSKRALEMAALMKMGKKPAEDARCLNCHGFSERNPELLNNAKKIVNEGVTCVVCHGPSKEWVLPHGDFSREGRLAWQKLTREDKDIKWGMRDLWDPAKRARLCASCHVGSAADGRVLTHEMYAAGHPPLPSFEPARFSETMRHWQYRFEKPEPVQKILGYKKGEMERTQLVAVGAAVTFESSMRLLAAEPRSPDMARFDCAACHHDLRSPSWRQQRGYSGVVPGRPMAPIWPSALLRATPGYAGESLKEYEERSARLKESFSKQPYGEPAQVAEEAGKLADWAAELAKRIAAKPMDEVAARRFLRALCDLQPGELLDYDSARQVAWAIEMVTKDLGAKSDALVALDGELRLALPSGRKQSIVDQLGDALKVRTRYDPQTFRKRIAEVSAALK
jgi:cytochrome c554/c'-like protein